MNQARFKIGKMEQKFIFYTDLLASPSTGKSAALKIFEDASNEVERANNISDENTTIVNCATVEAAVETLKNQSNSG